MTQIANIYCNESCHLEHDRQKVMVLGAIWCPFEKARETAQAIRDIKERHGLGRDFEIKRELWGQTFILRILGLSGRGNPGGEALQFHKLRLPCATDRAIIIDRS